MPPQAILLIPGLGLLVLGLVIFYNVRRRRFNRRTITGLQRFDTYGQSVVTRTGESLAAVLGFFLVVAGALLTMAGLSGENRSHTSRQTIVRPENPSSSQTHHLHQHNSNAYRKFVRY